MGDYIKRDEGPRTFIEIADDLNDLVTELNDKIVETIRNKPADMAPGRHGKWVVGGDADDFGWRWGTCSECGWAVLVRTNYCANCGAKMDKGVE